MIGPDEQNPDSEKTIWFKVKTSDPTPKKFDGHVFLEELLHAYSSARVVINNFYAIGKNKTQMKQIYSLVAGAKSQEGDSGDEYFAIDS